MIAIQFNFFLPNIPVFNPQNQGNDLLFKLLKEDIYIYIYIYIYL